MVSAMCGVQLKDRKRSTDFMFMLSFNETMDQLPMANSIRWYGDVLRREDCHVLRRPLDFDIEGQRKKGRPKSLMRNLDEEDSVKIGMSREGRCVL